MKLTDKQRVLIAWDDTDEDFGVLCFRDIARNSGLPIDAIKPIVRGLASDGLAAFRRGTMTDDGTLYGSGYELTEAGRRALSERGGS